LARWLVFAALGTILAGCGTLSGSLREDDRLTAQLAIADALTASVPEPPEPVLTSIATTPEEPASPEPTVSAAVEADAAACELPAAEPVVADGGESVVAAAGAAALERVVTEPPPAAAEPQDAWMAQARDPDAMDELAEPYDPWEPFNERMFEFNRQLDRFLLKPVAKAYNFITPEQLQIMISNGFDNIAFPPRFVNSVLQGKLGGAAREIGRFVINSTVGVGGLFDPAKDVFGLVKSREDFGQTLGFYGVGPGPFLIMPFMEPLTVRDGIGKAVDGAMDPLAYYLPLFWDRLGMKVGDVINERSLNLDLFQGFEESVIDLYSAVRHGYLQRREKLIRE
jgi:phospholipid-binding lipoprotein MlaA